MGIPSQDVLSKVYGDDAPRAAERLSALAARYDEAFGAGDPEFFTASGRTEIIGNHTDHNGGKILCASITMDSVAAAQRTDDGVVTIWSEGYPEAIVVDTNNIDKIAHGGGSTTLVAGMLEAAVKRGFKVGGFNAVASSEVIPSAGVSSSASFEMLVCEIVNHLYNDDAIERADYARIGQYAENVWWDKASGLMDQMACAVGGTILLDFSDGVKYEKVDFGFDELGHDLVIVNTGKGHADLSAEYSSVPNEMHDVAAALGVKNLCDSSEEAVLADLAALREKCGDRAVLRPCTTLRRSSASRRPRPPSTPATRPRCSTSSRPPAAARGSGCRTPSCRACPRRSPSRWRSPLRSSTCAGSAVGPSACTAAASQASSCA